MREMTLKLKMHMKGVNIINNNTEGFLLNIILGAFATLALFYVIILGSMVSDIVQRRTLEADARTLSNEVRNLELSYLSMSNSVDLPFSYSLGFRETQTIFATKRGLGFMPTDNVKITQNDI